MFEITELYYIKQNIPTLSWMTHLFIFVYLSTFISVGMVVLDDAQHSCNANCFETDLSINNVSFEYNECTY